MKKINDTKIYLSLIIVPLIIASLIGGVSMYSKLIVEPEVKALLASDATMKQAYLLLREPQIFGGYKYWDSDGMAVRNSLRYFDSKLLKGEEITSDERVYLELVLKRRISGSELGIKTTLFLLLVSAAGCAAYLIERIKNKSI